MLPCRCAFPLKPTLARTIAIAGLSTLSWTLAAPAQAGFIDAVRGIFSGDTGSRSTGTSRGGAIRNEYCQPETGAVVDEEIVALVPTTPQQTTAAQPQVFLYMPFERSRYPNVSLMLDVSQDGQPISETALPLPETAGMVAVQFPEDFVLVADNTYQWQVRVICENDDVPGVAVTADAPASPVADRFDIAQVTLSGLGGDAMVQAGQDREYALQSVFGEVQKVRVSPELAIALANDADTTRDYEAYLNEGIWFEMVAALAAAQSDEWLALLAEFELGNVEPTVEQLPQKPDPAAN